VCIGYEVDGSRGVFENLTDEVKREFFEHWIEGEEFEDGERPANFDEALEEELFDEWEFFDWLDGDYGLNYWQNDDDRDAFGEYFSLDDDKTGRQMREAAAEKIRKVWKDPSGEVKLLVGSSYG
jgi:hypothetical protein